MIDRRRFLASAVLSAGALATHKGLDRLALAAPASPTASATGSDGFVVDLTWLQSKIGEPSLKIIAFQDAKGFETAHIPSAAQIDGPTMELADTSDASVATWRTAMAARFAELGVAEGDTVVAYDNGTLYSARIWWVLDQIGHSKKVVLSGGLNAWTTGEGKTETGQSTPKPASTPSAFTPNDAGISTIDETIAAFNTGGATFIDARPPADYEKGHIPGAINIPYPSNATDAPESRWKTAAELRAICEKVGLKPDSTIIPYCTSGVRSAVTYLALRRAGYEQVALFTGSWNEWTKHPELPVATGNTP